MTTKFNIGDTVIYHHANGTCEKFKIDSIHITNEGTVYGGTDCIYCGITEDDLTKAPVTREEALAAALKDISKKVSKKIDIELKENEGCFEVWTKIHDGPYIVDKSNEYHYDEE